MERINITMPFDVAMSLYDLLYCADRMGKLSCTNKRFFDELESKMLNFDEFYRR